MIFGFQLKWLITIEKKLVSRGSRKMGAQSYKHYTTLSAESKRILQSGRSIDIMSQLKKLHKRFRQSQPCTKGPAHRHFLAVKHIVRQCGKELIKVRSSYPDSKSKEHPNHLVSTNIQCTTETETAGDSLPNQVSSCRPFFSSSERGSLYRRKMNEKKTQRVYTKKKSEAINSLNETIYKYYYQKLTSVTNMRASPIGPSYTTRAKTRRNGFSPEFDTQSYEDKFRDLLYKVKIKWKARDYVQRVFDFESLFCRLCTQIMDCVRNCISAKGHRLESMDRLDNLFRTLRRFKISSPAFKQKRVYRGGGPNKKKTDLPIFEKWGKPEAVGKEQLSVPLVDSLSKVLKLQFKQEHGLMNVCKLYKASRTSGPVSQVLKRYDINPVPRRKPSVQIHFCGNHYVTSEQKPSGMVVVHDSLVTDLEYKTELYPQLRYTYEILKQYSDPPLDLIQYETVQHQKDSTSCGVYAVLQAYFILSKKSYTINPDIGRSYLSNVLENTMFTNYDTFSSNYIINNYIRDQKLLQARKSESIASRSSATASQPLNTACKQAKRGRPSKYTEDEKQQRDKEKKLKYYYKSKAMRSKSRTDIKGDNQVGNVKKIGRPAKYSEEEKKQKDREKRLRYYHKSKITQNCIGIDQTDQNARKNIHLKRITNAPKQCPPAKRVCIPVESQAAPSNRGYISQISYDKTSIPAQVEHSAKLPKSNLKRGRPPKYSQEEKTIKDKEKRLKHYHKQKEMISLEQNQQKKKWHRDHKKTLRLNTKYREEEKARDQKWHKDRRLDEKYRENERAKERKWQKDKRQDYVYREEEKDKDRQWHKAKRQEEGYREDERSKEREWHRKKRLDEVYREEEKDRDREWHKDKRLDDVYREEEKDRDREWHKKKRLDEVFRAEEKDREREWHKEKRLDEIYREEEKDRDREWHKEKRLDKIYREEEKDRDREWHKEKRLDDAYRENERTKDNEWHKATRADPKKREVENINANKRKYGKNEEDAIKKYLAAIQTGPNVICTSCLQLWLPDNCRSLESMSFPNPLKVKECTTGTLFKGKEWLCSTCTRHLKENRIPPISHANGMKFLKIPDELALVQMEERCLALRQPFFQIRELPSGGQKSIKGNVVNVPMDVSKTINQLPRNLSDTETIGIKFKKKLAYKKSDYCENIRPQVVIRAAKYLIANSELYKAYNVKMNETWEETIKNNTDETLKTLVGIQQENLQNKSGFSQVPCQNSPTMHSAMTQQSDGLDPAIVEIDLTMSDDDNDISEKEIATVFVKCEKSTTASQNPKPNDKTVNMGDRNEESDDNFSEVDEMENYSGNMDTMLDSTVVMPAHWSKQNSQNATDKQNNLQNDKDMESNTTLKHVHTDADILVIAPGEGQQPISLFNDPDAEYLAFPSIYCGQRRPIDSQTNRKTKKRPSNADIFKWELRAEDRRVATCIPNIFFKVKNLQTDAVENVVGISVRKVKGKMQPTAGELKTPQGRDKLRNLNEGVNMFRRMRNTPPYYASKKKSFLAMIRQGGMPALFFTQSCADTRWPELLRILGKLIDKEDYTDAELENMSHINRNRLVAADPVTVVRYFENKCNKFQKHIMNLRGSFKQFYRREFQQRGSPHSHEVHWIKEAPVYDPNKPENDKNVTKFIDTWISTEVEVIDEEKKYLKYQIHKHSTSCRKRGEAICRFGIPFFPMKNTTILKPLAEDEVDDERLQTLKDWYQEMRQTLNEMGEGLDISHEQFLEKINMSETVYLLTIRCSLSTAKVFYKRKPNALRVNPYMRGMLAVIRANHDVQYPLNVYALVCYVADYLLKSQKGLSATLEQACRDVMDGDMKLKQQIRHIGYKLLSTIETSAPEACYYIMQIPFTYCSVEVVFIPTSPPEDRTYVLKSEEELSELPEESRDVLKSNSIAAYAKRPKKLHNMCLADYVSELTVQYNKNEKPKEKSQNGLPTNPFDYDENDDDLIPSEDEEDVTVNEDIFPLVTKCATFKKRRNPRVIRFVNYNRTHDPENYCREKLLLYMPWRREEMLKGESESYIEAFEANEIIIRNNMSKYEKFAEEVLQAEEMIDATEDDLDYNIAPNTEQTEREDEIIGPVDSPEFGFFRPPKNGEQPETSADILYNAGVAGASDTNIETMAGFMSEDNYLEMVRSLNEKQFQIYTHILHHISKDNVQPLHIFITGGAGVGKSMVLRCVYQGLLRLLAKKEGQNPEAPRIIIAAPTGKAAYLVEGNTIHSILKILPSRGNNYVPLSDVHKDSIRIKFRNLNTIIIDEVSMVGNTMLSFIHLRLQEIMENDKPFGGLNVILFGDPYQLSPVMDGWIFEDLDVPDKNEDDEMKKDEKKKRKRKKKLTSAAALAPNIWKENFTCFELTEVMRQKGDQIFCDILNRMREGNHTEEDIRIIKQNCELPGNEPDNLLHVPHFYFSNMERNIHNQKVLLAKEGETVCVCAIDICTQSTLPKKERERIEANVKKLRNLHETGNLETELKLKIGIPYDMTINVDTEDGLCNGAALILREMLYLDEQRNIPSVLLVEAEDDRIGRKARSKWKALIPDTIRKDHPSWIPILSAHSQYMYLLKHPIKREQFPLSLAAGKTFHKSQGSSLTQAVMSFPEKRKVAHLHYVGLSRVTKMSGIKILHGQFNEDKIHVHDGVKAEMSRLRAQAKLKLCFTPLSEIASNLLVGSFNAQSLHKHIKNVKADWNIKSTMVLGICETRIKQGEDTSKYEMADFKFYHIEQMFQSNPRPYHGVALYVKNMLPSTPMFYICTDEFECVARDVFIPSTQSNVQIVMCYTKPGTANELLLKALQEIVMHINVSQPVIIMGDFNINKEVHERLIRKMSWILKCKQIISDVTTKANTCIDLMFTNMKATEHGSIFTAVSHHHLTYASFEDTSIKM